MYYPNFMVSKISLKALYGTLMSISPSISRLDPHKMDGLYTPHPQFEGYIPFPSTSSFLCCFPSYPQSSSKVRNLMFQKKSRALQPPVFFIKSQVKLPFKNWLNPANSERDPMFQKSSSKSCWAWALVRVLQWYNWRNVGNNWSCRVSKDLDRTRLGLFSA